MEELESAIEKGRQVIVAVEEDAVTLYDPSFGYTPLAVSRNHFLDVWENSNKYYVTVFKY